MIERMQDVAGLEHAKRAIEVAICGNHPLALIGEPNHADAARLAAIAHELGVSTVWALRPCLCGFFGSIPHSCTCGVEKVRRFRHRGEWRRAVEGAAMYIEIPAVPYEKLTGAVERREPQERVLDRIAEARIRPPVSTTLYDGASQRLMQAAMRQLHFTSVQYTQVLRVAATVARLAHEESIRPAHLAEALQYQLRPAMLLSPTEAL
jgi:predicted ATPase with chaperone activity